MAREQAYIERQVDDYDQTRKAKPVKIVEDVLDRDTDAEDSEDSGPEDDVDQRDEDS